MADNARVIMQLNSLKGVGRVFPRLAAEVIVRRAKQLAPVDTGFMRNNIHAEEDAVISEAPYSAYVEYGTKKMAAQPFMRPAVDEGQSEILRVAGKVIEEEIRRLIGR